MLIVLIQINRTHICQNTDEKQDDDEKVYSDAMDRNKDDIGTSLRSPSNGWLPNDVTKIDAWRHDKIAEHIQESMTIEDAIGDASTLNPAVKELLKFMVSPVIDQLVNDMIQQNKRWDGTTQLGRITNVMHLVQTLDGIVSDMPQFHNGQLVGCPIAALFTGGNLMNHRIHFCLSLSYKSVCGPSVLHGAFSKWHVGRNRFVSN